MATLCSSDGEPTVHDKTTSFDAILMAHANVCVPIDVADCALSATNDCSKLLSAREPWEDSTSASRLMFPGLVNDSTPVKTEGENEDTGPNLCPSSDVSKHSELDEACTESVGVPKFTKTSFKEGNSPSPPAPLARPKKRASKFPYQIANPLVRMIRLSRLVARKLAARLSTPLKAVAPFRTGNHVLRVAKSHGAEKQLTLLKPMRKLLPSACESIV